MQDIILIGSGGCMRELLWQLQVYNCRTPHWNVIGYADKTDAGTITVGKNEYPYLGDDAWILQKEEKTAISICVGSPILRKKLAETYRQNPNIVFPNLILSETQVCTDVRMGEGCILSMDTRVSTNVTLGDFVFLNTGAMVCHDGILEDFVTVSPRATLAGNVKVGEASEIGLGANVIQGITIGANTVIGAGSVVIGDIPSDCTAVGVPADRIRGHKKNGSSDYSRSGSES